MFVTSSAAKRGPAHSATLCFSVLADADPGVLPRLLELFAKRNLVPDRWHSDRQGPQGGELSVDLQVTGLEADTAELIARSMSQVFGVTQVLLSEKAQ